MRAQRAWDQVVYEQHALLIAQEQMREHDVCHCFLGPQAFALSGAGPVVHTIQGQVTRDLEWFAGVRGNVALTVPAAPQAEVLRAAGAPRRRVAANGVDFGPFPLRHGDRPGPVFLPRLTPPTGPDLAL